jgi:hypothetical protein
MPDDLQLSEQKRNQELAEAAVTAAGYTASRSTSGKDLEVYFDIIRGEQDVGFISKGWTDPGFRIGELVTVPEGYPEDAEPPEYLRDFCATNGVALTRSRISDDTDWMLEYVIYSSGFNAEMLRESLATFVECSERVKHDLSRRLMSELFSGGESSESVALPA